MILLKLVFFSFVDHTVSWGQEPHYIVAHIAAHFLPEETALHIQNLLGFPFDTSMDGFADQLSSLGMWADQPEAEWSKYYHIAHTRQGFPEWDITKDCGYKRNGICLPTGIANWTAIASDPLASATKRRESVKFLLHVMADIHQPLHVGLWDDFGGNKITNIYPSFTPGPWSDSYSLHQLWDRGLFLYWQNNLHSDTTGAGVAPWKRLGNELILNMRVNKSLRDQYRMMSSSGDLTQRSVALGLPTRIATETVRVAATQAYFDEAGRKILPDTHVSEAYMLSRVEVMKVQLAKAGFRLALLLKDIVTRATDWDNPRDDLTAALASLDISTSRRCVPSPNDQYISETLVVSASAIAPPAPNSSVIRPPAPSSSAMGPPGPKFTIRKKLGPTAPTEEVKQTILPKLNLRLLVPDLSNDCDRPPRLTRALPAEGWALTQPAAGSVEEPWAQRRLFKIPQDSVLPTPPSVTFNTPSISAFAMLPPLNILQCPYCQKNYSYPKCLETHKSKCLKKK